MPTLRDVAVLAGVSTATVSHVINQTRRTTRETRERVELAIRQLGFVPNAAGRALAMRKTGVGASHAPSSFKGKNGNGAAVAEAVEAPAQTPTVAVGASRMILRLVRAAQPIPRVEIARRLGLNRSTVTEVVKPLLAEGVLREGQEVLSPGVSRTSGRPAVALSFGDLKEFFVGVSVGVRHTTVGLATLAGERFGEEEFETPTDPSEALSRIRATVRRLCAKVPGRELKVIGVSVPGPTDATRERMVYAPHLGWRGVDVAQALSVKPCGVEGGAAVPVVVENDATAAALYEARLRLGNGSESPTANFALVRSGTGIGVGLVLGGEVYRGTGGGEGLAGEFGHMTIVAGGKPCRCGNRGCWEMYASASAASSLYAGDRVQLGGQTPPRFVEIVARAEGGELRAQRTLERVGEYLGIGIGNVIMGLGVSRVIVSGRLVYGWKFMREQIHNAVAQSMAGRLHGWSVEPGEATGAGLGGALEVAAEGFITSGLV
jgi:predicted NBD/HSP70 family sugar kinase